MKENMGLGTLVRKLRFYLHQARLNQEMMKQMKIMGRCEKLGKTLCQVSGSLILNVGETLISELEAVDWQCDDRSENNKRKLNNILQTKYKQR